MNPGWQSQLELEILQLHHSSRWNCLGFEIGADPAWEPLRAAVKSRWASIVALIFPDSLNLW
jgi:hypothetical protein